MANITNVKFRKLSDKAFIPVRSTPLSAGLDLFSPNNYYLKARRRILVSLELQVQLPSNCFGKIESKSGNALLHGLHIGAGIIDEDFSGNISVLIYNLGESNHLIFRGDPIAQLIVQKCIYPEPIECLELATTDRQCGFGELDIKKNSKPIQSRADSTSSTYSVSAASTSRPLSSPIVYTNNLNSNRLRKVTNIGSPQSRFRARQSSFRPEIPERKSSMPNPANQRELEDITEDY